MARCQKDTTYGIFLKRGLFKDIINDIPSQTHKYFSREYSPSISSESRTVVQVIGRYFIDLISRLNSGTFNPKQKPGFTHFARKHISHDLRIFWGKNLSLNFYLCKKKVAIFMKSDNLMCP